MFYATETMIRLAVLSAFPKCFTTNEETLEADRKLEPKGLNSMEQLEYTSLRDVMVMSRAKWCHSSQPKDLEWCDISKVTFKDKLLKQAAKAYLQPMGAPEMARKTMMHILSEYWTHLSHKNKLLVANVKEYAEKRVEACVKFLRTQAFNLFEEFGLFPKLYIEFLAPR